MSLNLRKCMKAMHLFCDAKSKRVKKSILADLSKNDCFFEAIFEIVNNIYLRNVEKNYQMSSLEKKKLKKFVNIFDKILKHPKNKVKKRKLVIQSGGFLPILLPIITSIVTELLKNAIRQKSDTDSA